MQRTPFTASTATGDLGGWVAGDGPPVLALHGGPGLGYEYLDEVVEEIGTRHRVATFQQRGLEPSTVEGEFTIDEALADVVAVLDELGWDRALVMGHSWGGHLALHAAAAIPDRLSGVLAVDPLGAVGDGGAAEFGATMVARTPEASRPRVLELADKEEAVGLTPEEDAEQLALVWPAYFAEPSTAPPMPPTRMSQPSFAGLWADVVARLPGLEAALPTVRVPVGVLLGEGSPIPATAGTGTAARIPGAWCHSVPGAGHFVWSEAPGSVVAAMERLTGPPA